MELTINEKYTKTYATKENARKAVVKNNADKLWYMIVKLDSGKYTPVFFGTNTIHMAHRGFKIIAA